MGWGGGAGLLEGGGGGEGRLFEKPDSPAIGLKDLLPEVVS